MTTFHRRGSGMDILGAMIGERIRHYRLMRRMSLARVAAGICSPAHLSRVERGTRLPTAELLASLADRLGVPLVDLSSSYLDEPLSVHQKLSFALQLAKRAYVDCGERTLEEIQRALKSDPAPAQYAGVLWESLGVVRSLQGRHAAAKEAFQLAAHSHARSFASKYAFSRLQFRFGTALLVAGCPMDATRELEKALRSIREVDRSSANVAHERIVKLHERIVQNLCVAWLHLNEYGAARQTHELTRGFGKAFDVSIPESHALELIRAVAELGLGDLSSSIARLEVVVDRCVQREPQLHGTALVCLGIARRLSGDPRSGREYLQRALAALGERRGRVAHGLYNELARLAIWDNDLVAARHWLSQAEECAQWHGGMSAEWLCADSAAIRMCIMLTERGESHASDGVVDSIQSTWRRMWFSAQQLKPSEAGRKAVKRLADELRRECFGMCDLSEGGIARSNVRGNLFDAIAALFEARVPACTAGCIIEELADPCDG